MNYRGIFLCLFLIFLINRGSHDDDEYLRQRRIFFKFFQKFPAIDHGHVEIQKNQKGIFGAVLP